MSSTLVPFSISELVDGWMEEGKMVGSTNFFSSVLCFVTFLSTLNSHWRKLFTHTNLFSKQMLERQNVHEPIFLRKYKKNIFYSWTFEQDSCMTMCMEIIVRSIFLSNIIFFNFYISVRPHGFRQDLRQHQKPRILSLCQQEFFHSRYICDGLFV